MAYYSPDSYTARDSIGYLLHRSSSLLRGRLEGVFAAQEVTFTQWLVMMYLRERISRNSAEICRSLGHDSGAFARVIDQLAQRDLVERARSTLDRRIVDLTLTERGSRTVELMIPMVVDCLNGAIAGLTRDETESLVRLLMKLTLGLSGPEGCVATGPGHWESNT
jgi:DNA-binding MarR family transcriptional regulator